MKLRQIEKEKQYWVNDVQMKSTYNPSQVIGLYHCCPWEMVERTFNTWRPQPPCPGQHSGYGAWYLSKGRQDHIVVAADLDDPHGFYVLTDNLRLGYVGLEYCHIQDSWHPMRPHDWWIREPTSVFFQDPDDPRTGCPQPKPFLEYEWHTQIRRLAEHLPARRH